MLRHHTRAVSYNLDLKKVKFIEISRETHFEYHLPCGDGMLDNSLFYKKFELEQEVLDKWYKYLWDSGITNLATEENSLLYSLIIKSLTSKECVDISTFGRSYELTKYLHPIETKEIEWKNSIEFTTDDKNFCRQYGYQTPAEFLNEMNYSNRDLTNRGFKISRVTKANLDSFIKTYNSDVTSWTFFLDSDWNKLIYILQNSSKRPKINQFLEFSDYIVDIQIGGDEGYLDYVLIQSKTKLTDKTKLLEELLTRFGRSFEKIISDLSPINEKWKVIAFKEGLNEIKKVANV